MLSIVAPTTVVEPVVHLVPVAGDEAGLFEKVEGGGPYDRERSDAICSALQFINFWQDVAPDWRKGRVYLPQEDIRKLGADPWERRVTPEWCDLMAFEIARAALGGCAVS